MQALLSETPTIDLLASMEAMFLSTVSVVSVITAVMLTLRPDHGRLLVPYQPRRQVPWGGGSVVLIFLFHIYIPILLALLLAPLVLDPAIIENPVLPASAESTPVETTTPESETDQDAAHQVVKLIQRGEPWMILVVCFSTFLITPIAEEFLFRLVLQGFLEKVEHRSRNWLRAEMRESERIGHLTEAVSSGGFWILRLLCSLPRGAFSIVMTSGLFAMLHFRAAGDEYHLEWLMFAIALTAIANILTVIVGTLWLRSRGANAADLGWDLATLPLDIRNGLVTFLLIAGPIYLLQKGLSTVLAQPWVVEMVGVKLAPDPVTIFLFSLVLGFLYLRTHRLAASVTVHMALNGTTLMMILLGTTVQ